MTKEQFVIAHIDTLNLYYDGDEPMRFSTKDEAKEHLNKRVASCLRNCVTNMYKESQKEVKDDQDRTEGAYCNAPIK